MNRDGDIRKRNARCPASPEQVSDGRDGLAVLILFKRGNDLQHLLVIRNLTLGCGAYQISYAA